MGNCLLSHGSAKLSVDLTGCEEIIMVMRSDGKIMEYTPPLLARDLMAAFPQHSVIHSEDATCRSLSPNQKLVPEQLYRLLIIPKLPCLSEDAVLAEATSIDNGRIVSEKRVHTRLTSVKCVLPSIKSVQDGSGILGVKMEISKLEVQTLVSSLPRLQCIAEYDDEDYVATQKCSNDRWRPSLKTIPEVN